jgi:hypothetical protein
MRLWKAARGCRKQTRARYPIVIGSPPTPFHFQKALSTNIYSSVNLSPLSHSFNPTPFSIYKVIALLDGFYWLCFLQQQMSVGSVFIDRNQIRYQLIASY